MNIYDPMPSDGYELIHPVRAEDFETLNILINGFPRKDNWQPLDVKLIRHVEGRQLLESDAPWLGAHALMFKPKAAVVLEPLLIRHGELLPLSCHEVTVSVFNVTRVVDALDESASA